MKRVKMTKRLNVFGTEVFQPFGGDDDEVPVKRRMYVGFERDMTDGPYRVPAITALFTLLPTDDGGHWYFLEWLETSQHYDDDNLAQAIRDEFMGAVEEL